MGLVRPTTFKYDQTVPSTTWNINHNLSGNGSQGIPIVDVHVDDGSGNLSKIIPASTEIIDANNVTLTFSIPRTGYAVICA